MGAIDIVRQAREDGDSMVVSILRTLKKKQGEVDFVKLIRASNVDVLAIIAPGLEDKELDDFLSSKKLMVLKPIPDLSSFFEEGTSPEEILKHINENTDKDVSISELTPSCAKAVASLVFADKSKPNAGVIDDFAELLTRVMCRPDDFDVQKAFLFVMQEAWFNAGKAKGLIKELFIKMYDNGFIAVEAFNMWKEDSKNKTKGKMPALLQTNGWIEEIQPIEHDDEGDEEQDEEDEGDEQIAFDDYLANNPKEYF